LLIDFNNLLDEHKKHHEDNLRSIARGLDDVSKILAPLFDVAVRETPEELARARLRRERGQPPGKDKNVLGDQISWEQILGAIGDQTDLWIVSDDSDFADKIGNELILKPTLRREVIEVSKSIDVRCFSDLLMLLDVVREIRLVDEGQLPSTDTVSAAKKEVELGL
jgi:hypothetical protein